MDLVVAAVADRRGLDVLDYDLIAATTDLEFRSVWLAAPGRI